MIIVALSLVIGLMDGQLPSPKADLLANARARCAKDWPSDFSMQEFCVKRQVAGAEAFAETFRQFRGEKERLEPALEKCLKDWSDGDNVDWNMASFCARKQADALLRLER